MLNIDKLKICPLIIFDKTTLKTLLFHLLIADCELMTIHLFLFRTLRAMELEIKNALV